MTTMRQRIAARARRLWDEFFLFVLVGVPIAIVIAVWHAESERGAVRAVLADSTRGTLFSALIGFAALLLSVMLAVLTIFTTMDEREIVKRFKQEQEGRMYLRLVHAMLGPIFVSLGLAAFSIVCIALSSGLDPAQGNGVAAPSGVAVFFVSLTLGLASTCLVQGAYVAMLIVNMLTFQPRRPLLTPGDAPTAEAKKKGAAAAVAEEGDDPIDHDLRVATSH